MHKSYIIYSQLKIYSYDPHTDHFDLHTDHFDPHTDHSLDPCGDSRTDDPHTDQIDPCVDQIFLQCNACDDVSRNDRGSNPNR